MVRAEAAFSLSQAIITRERPSSRHTSSAAASMRVAYPLRRREGRTL